MKSKVIGYMIVAILILGTGIAFAYESITAAEAYDMVNDGEAIMVDVRTLEECLWVGMPNIEYGGLYVIPLYTATIIPDIDIIDGMKVVWAPNTDFIALVLQEFGNDKGQALITMCRSGGRSTAAADLLEDNGFSNVYEVDNALKGGRGGFQGTNYGSDYDGYRGYPARLPHNQSPKQVTVQTSTDRIRNPESSVSWMDTGLPITQDLKKAVIPVLDD